jgi:hypothetical protein
MNKYKFDFLIAFSVFIMLMGFLGVRAQSIGISPVSIDTNVKPGSSYTQNFTITNSSGSRFRFRCSTEDLWFDEKGVRLEGRAGTLPRSGSLWAQFSSSEMIVEPRTSAVVQAVITIPPRVTGSFYIVPVFEGSPDVPANSKTGRTTATIGVRFRGLIMLTTTEGSEYNIEIMGGSITPPTATTELQVSLDLRNRGTAHAKIRGAYAIVNAAGQLVGRGAIDEKTYLPTQRKNLESLWSGALPPGNYTCLATLSYNRVGSEPVSMIYEIPFTVK